MTEIRTERLAAIAAFLPELEAPGFSAGEWRGGDQLPNGSIQMPWFEQSTRVQELMGAIGSAGFVAPFDWMRWLDSPEGAAFRDEPGRIERATLDDLAHLLTAIIRGDRFVEGNIAGAIESGVMVRIVRRIDALTSGSGP